MPKWDVGEFSDLTPEEMAVVKYVQKWQSDGAPGQKYAVFEYLAMPMPAASCVELFVLREVPGTRGGKSSIQLFCTPRAASDRYYAGMLHNVGSAPMMSVFVGRDNESEFDLIKDPWLAKVIEKAKKDKLMWNAGSILKRMLTRVIRRDAPGLSDRQIRRLVNQVVEVGHQYNWTPRGAESAVLTVLDATNTSGLFTGGVWVDVTKLRSLAKEGKFIGHQLPRLRQALPYFKKFAVFDTSQKRYA